MHIQADSISTAGFVASPPPPPQHYTSPSLHIATITTVTPITTTTIAHTHMRISLRTSAPLSRTQLPSPPTPPLLARLQRAGTHHAGGGDARAGRTAIVACRLAQLWHGCRPYVRCTDAVFCTGAPTHTHILAGIYIHMHTLARTHVFSRTQTHPYIHNYTHAPNPLAAHLCTHPHMHSLASTL